MSRSILKLGALDASKTAFLLCDIQEIFRKHIKMYADLVKIANKMAIAARHFKIPWSVSEQYPKGLGHTTKDIRLHGAGRSAGIREDEVYEEFPPANTQAIAARHFKIPWYVSEQYPKGLGHTTKDIRLHGAALVYEKTRFSMITPKLEDKLRKDVPGLMSVVIFGLETHVCIEQTVIDLLNRDIAVHVLADGVSSRSLMDRGLALQRIQGIGGFITTSENVLFKLMQDKNHPEFKVISKLNKEPTKDTMGFDKLMKM